MNRKDIESLVAIFLKEQPNNFSPAWRDKLVERVEMLESKRPVPPGDLTDEERLKLEDALEVVIEKTHWEMVFKLLRDAAAWLRHKYPILTDYDVERIMDDAFDIWRKRFDANKGRNVKEPELGFLIFLAYRKEANYFRKNYPVTRKDIDADGNKRAKRIKTLSLEEFYYLEDTRNYFDSDELRKDAEQEDLDQDSIDNNEMHAKPIKFGRQLLPHFSFTEVFRYYLLTQRLVYETPDHKLAAKIIHVDGKPAYTEITQPRIKDEYQPEGSVVADTRNDFMPDSEEFEFLNTNNPAQYYRQRWQILRSANSVRWAEAAVFKFRESGMKRLTPDQAKVTS